MKLLSFLPLLLLLVPKDNVVRLSPMEFEYVPLPVRKQLTEMGCTIPQVSSNIHGGYVGQKHNIVSGQFATPEQTDWAAICSRNGRSSVVVLWGGSVNCKSAVTAARRDSSMMEFDRLVLRLLPWRKGLYNSDKEAGVPETRTHDALNYAILERAAVAYYCHEGEWLRFITSD